MTAAVDNWKKRGACRPEDLPAAFGTEAQQRDFVRRCCTRCPVIAICNEAGANEAGAWGGLTEGDRNEQRRLQQHARRASISRG